ncbi:hypothetical protein DMC64_13385 [Amycolatopsis sp. WAC 04197]|nr:hypothetical protein DMC64_13385 [Amycolatopsis sp. WAC 04197]
MKGPFRTCFVLNGPFMTPDPAGFAAWPPSGLSRQAVRAGGWTEGAGFVARYERTSAETS